MRKLVRDPVTKLYLMENGQWTSQDTLAYDFLLIPMAEEMQRRILPTWDGNLEWFYAFDFPGTAQYDFALKLH